MGPLGQWRDGERGAGERADRWARGRSETGRVFCGREARRGVMGERGAGLWDRVGGAG